MHVLHANPIRVPGDDIQPIHIVQHIFMIHPIVGRMDAIAYRSCGEKTLLLSRALGCCPPFPKKMTWCCSNLTNWAPPSRLLVAVL